MTRLILNHNKLDKSIGKLFRRILANPSFITGIKAIRKKFQNEIDSSRKNNEVPLDGPMRLELDNLRKKLEYNDTWFYFFAYYLVYDKIPSNYNPRLPYLETSDDEQESEKQFFLRITSETTSRDFDNAYSEIRRAVKSQETPTRLKRLQEVIIDLHNRGMMTVDIRQRLIRKFNQKLTNKQIQAIINRFKNGI